MQLVTSCCIAHDITTSATAFLCFTHIVIRLGVAVILETCIWQVPGSRFLLSRLRYLYLNLCPPGRLQDKPRLHHDRLLRDASLLAASKYKLRNVSFTHRNRPLRVTPYRLKSRIPTFILRTFCRHYHSLSTPEVYSYLYQ